MTTLASARRLRAGPLERIRSAALRLDWVLVLACAAVTAFSLFVISRSTRTDIVGQPNFYLNRQLLYVAVGAALLAIATRIDIERVTRWSWALWGSLLGALAVVWAIGSAVRGSNRWIDIGPFSLQPSELGKVVLMVVLAGVAVERLSEVGSARYSLLLAGIAAVPLAVIFVQPDLGTSMVYAVILAAILFLVGAPWTHFAVFGATLALVLTAVLWILPTMGMSVLQDYQVERLTAFAGAQRDTSDAGYQLDQSTTAVGSGGTLGKGPDGATQATNNFLPEHHTDFIFAVTAEMFGFVGGGLLILLYALILWRGLRTMARASSQVEMLVAGAIVAMIGFQVFVNIGMTVGIMPITGIPLPMMSFGGSHTITTLLAIGLLLGIHRRRSPVAG